MENAEMNCNAEMSRCRSSVLPLFLTGVGTGIALTLLLAPLSGSATRDLIARKARKGEDWVKTKASAAEDYVTTRTADLRDRVNDVAEVMTRS